MHTRAEIILNSVKDIERFVSIINSDGTTDRYYVEDFYGRHRVNARSFLGMVYASGDFDTLYLVNESNDGHFTYLIDQFRP